MSMLKGEGITKRFGGLVALSNVDFEVGKGEIVGLIGPNGSGKTTLFNVISGFYTPDSGQLTLNGHSIAGLQPYQIARLGIGRTFQIVRPFAGLSVLDNVKVGVLYGRSSVSESQAASRAMELLHFAGLANKANALGSSLTLVDKKRLEVTRALATGPEIILLDEVFAGLNPVEVDEAIDLIFRIRNELGITVFMIEHVMKATMQTCDRIIVLSFGQKLAEGKPDEIANNQAVVDVYLGAAHACT